MTKKIKIMGAAWTIRVLDQETFNELHKDCGKSGALTMPFEKELHFIFNEIDLGTVRHEVRHAFLSEFCLESAELTCDQMEEINCTIDQYKWDQLDKVSRDILKLIT